MSRIAEKNDFLRKFLPTIPPPNRLFITTGLVDMGRDTVDAVLEKVRGFQEFTPDNDPYGEHDAGVVEHEGEDYYWKFDYVDEDMETYKEDGIRFLTIMRLKDY